MRGVFAFPLVSDGETMGVLAFNSGEVRERQEHLVRAISAIGSQIGQFLRRKRAEDELQRFRLAMDSSADMIVLIDRASMRFVDVNRTVCEQLGYSREEMLAMGPGDLVPLSREALAQQYDDLIADSQAPDGLHSHYARKDGSLLPFESKRRVLRSGDKVIIAAISRDISERLATESALKQSEARLRGQAEQQRMVAELGQQALASSDIPHVLQRAAELSRATLKVDYCDVLERDPERARLVYRGAAGWPADWVDRRSIELQPGGQLEHTLSSSEPLVVEDHADGPALPARPRRCASSASARACACRSSARRAISASSACTRRRRAASARTRSTSCAAWPTSWRSRSSARTPRSTSPTSRSSTRSPACPTGTCSTTA